MFSRWFFAWTFWRISPPRQASAKVALDVRDVFSAAKNRDKKQLCVVKDCYESKYLSFSGVLVVLVVESEKNGSGLGRSVRWVLPVVADARPHRELTRLPHGALPVFSYLHFSWSPVDVRAVKNNVFKESWMSPGFESLLFRLLLLQPSEAAG